MKNSLRFACSLALALPTLAGAVGLGDIHISSALNQPLSAEIEVLNATPEELAQVRAALASRDTFARYGLERPSVLGSLNFRVGRNAAGHPALLVRSNEAIGEPFLSFLVELDWPRGHLVREYAVLLDPPVYAPTTPAPTVAAPVTGTAAVRVAAPERSAPVESTSGSRAPVSADGSVQVGRGDTLSRILTGHGITDSAELRRAMIATFRANPDAFLGNINRLRRGAILRVPPHESWAGLDAHEASQEIARQNDEWRTAAPSDTKLRLVVPPDTAAVSDGGRPVATDRTPAKPSAATASSSSTAAPAATASDPRSAIEAQLAEARHQIELQNAELARLEAQLKSMPAATPATSVPGEAPAPSSEAPAPAAPAPTVTPKAKVAAAVAPEPGMMDTLADNALPILGGAVALLAAFLIGRNVLERRRRAQAADAADAAEEIDEGYASTAPGAMDTHPHLAATPRPAGAAIEVTEHGEDPTGEFKVPGFNSLRTQSIPHSATPDHAPPDSRIGASQSIALDSTDPIAEADFNISLGLYDPAINILKLAIEQHPKRVDLALKLIEVYFIAGRKSEFLERARAYASMRDRVPAGDWAQVAIMGRQIAPEEALFNEASTPSDAVDFDVHNPDATVGDVEQGAALTAATSSADLDLPLHDDAPTLDPSRFEALLDQTATTRSFGREMAAPAARPTTPPSDQDLLDLVLETSLTNLKQPGKPASGATTAKDMDLLFGADDAKGGKPSSALQDTELDLFLDAPSASANASDPRSGAPADWTDPEATVTGGVTGTTAEISLEDLGLDDTALDLGAQSAATGETWADEELQKLVDLLPPEQAKPRAVPATAPEAADAPAVAKKDTPVADLSLDLADLARALEQDTMAVRTAERFKTDILATGVHPTRTAGTVSTDGMDPIVSERKHAADIDLPDLDPVTLSEVGTKLDLARAYLDMGDPDGARSILQEVMQEGGPAQREEAKRLLGTLPG